MVLRLKTCGIWAVQTVPSSRRNSLPPSNKTRIFMNTATRTSNIAEVVPVYTQIAFCTSPFVGRVRFLRCFSFFVCLKKNMVDIYKIYASGLQIQHCTAKSSERLAYYEPSASSPECAPSRPHWGLAFTGPHRTDPSSRISTNLALRLESIAASCCYVTSERACVQPAIKFTPIMSKIIHIPQLLAKVKI